MEPGFSTGKGLGLGLSGSGNLMDELQIVSGKICGTRVTARKSRRAGGRAVAKANGQVCVLPPRGSVAHRVVLEVFE